MYLLVFLGLFGVAISQTSTDVTHCPASVPRNNYLKVYGGKCLQFVLTERAWSNARTDCKSRGGDLMMIKNSAKQAFVYNTLKTGLHWRYKGLWLGGSDRDREGTWVWVDGTLMAYGNWHHGQGPTAHHGFFFSTSSFEDCAQMRLDDGGRWHDNPCSGSSYQYSYICEYDIFATSQQPSTQRVNCSLFYPVASLAKYYKNACLSFVKDDKSWNDANAECISLGGLLLQIHSQQDQDFVFESLRFLHWSDSGAWIGATDRGSEGHWRWSDGSPVNYAQWNPGDGPSHNATNENCAMISVDDGMWFDYDCGAVIYNQAYICQYGQWLV